MDKINWNNPEEVKEYYRKYCRKWREKNRKKICEYNKKYNEENKERKREYNKKYYQKNKEKFYEKNRKYRERNKEKLSKQRKESYNKKRHEAIDKLGGKCVMCDWIDKRALTFDHIKGDGYRDRKKNFRTEQLIMWILKTPIEEVKKKIQILCENHNRIKQREGEEFRKN